MMNNPREGGAFMKAAMLALALTLTWAAPARAVMNEACEGPDGVMSTDACANRAEPDLKTYTPAQFAQMTGAAPSTVVLEMLDPFMIEAGLLPKIGAAVTIDGMVPYQKVEGGYLIRVSPRLVQTWDAARSIAFYKTNDVFQDGQELTGTVLFAGHHEYAAINGFKNEVLAFRSVRQ